MKNYTVLFLLVLCSCASSKTYTFPGHPEVKAEEVCLKSDCVNGFGNDPFTPYQAQNSTHDASNETDNFKKAALKFIGKRYENVTSQDKFNLHSCKDLVLTLDDIEIHQENTTKISYKSKVTLNVESSIALSMNAVDAFLNNVTLNGTALTQAIKDNIKAEISAEIRVHLKSFLGKDNNLMLDFALVTLKDDLISDFARGVGRFVNCKNYLKESKNEYVIVSVSLVRHQGDLVQASKLELNSKIMSSIKSKLAKLGAASIDYNYELELAISIEKTVDSAYQNLYSSIGWKAISHKNQDK